MVWNAWRGKSTPSKSPEDFMYRYSDPVEAANDQVRSFFDRFDRLKEKGKV